jgi:hypothetical protein
LQDCLCPRGRLLWELLGLWQIACHSRRRLSFGPGRFRWKRPGHPLAEAYSTQHHIPRMCQGGPAVFANNARARERKRSGEDAGICRIAYVCAGGCCGSCWVCGRSHVIPAAACPSDPGVSVGNGRATRSRLGIPGNVPFPKRTYSSPTSLPFSGMPRPRNDI